MTLNLSRRAGGLVAAIVIGIGAAGWAGCGDDAEDEIRDAADQIQEEVDKAQDELSEDAQDKIDKAQEETDKALEDAGY